MGGRGSLISRDVYADHARRQATNRRSRSGSLRGRSARGPSAGRGTVNTDPSSSPKRGLARHSGLSQYAVGMERDLESLQFQQEQLASAVGALMSLTRTP